MRELEHVLAKARVDGVDGSLRSFFELLEQADSIVLYPIRLQSQ